MLAAVADKASSTTTTTIPLLTVLITAVAVVLASLIAAIAADRRSKNELREERKRLQRQLDAESDRLSRQLADARVDELRSVLENATLAFLQASNALKAALLVADSPLDVDPLTAQLAANDARIAVRLGSSHAITTAYRDAAQKWIETVTLAAIFPDAETAAEVEARKEATALAFNTGSASSTQFINLAAALIGPVSETASPPAVSAQRTGGRACRG